MSESNHQATFEAPDSEEVGQLFPAYDVHALIACGGMGAVYQATQRSLDRGVAIKILPREFSNDEAFRIGFEAEAKAMAKLNHPNLIGVYDFGEVDGMLFIVMEYVHGKSLFHSVHGRALEESEALRLTTEVCHGLAHAHEYGVLHRDIKPSNILLDENANPKIGDFGLARALESEIQEGEQIFGTPGYTAPEVVEPPYTFDHRADIFSVGVMLYELLTGKTPGAVEGSPSQFRVSNPRINAIIQKATHPDPNARFSSASELAANIEKIAASNNKSLVAGTSSSRARPNAPHAVTSPTLGKKSFSGGTIALLALAIVAVAIVFVVKSQKNKDAESEKDGDEPGAERIIVVDVPPKDPGDEPLKDQDPPEDPSQDTKDFNPFESPLVPVVPTDPDSENLDPQDPGEDPEPQVPDENPDPQDPDEDPEPKDPDEDPDPQDPDEDPEPKDPDSENPEPQVPDEDPDPPAEPKYDVAAFLDRARDIMKEKVAPDIETYEAGIVTNTDAFERKLRFIAQDFYRTRRAQAESAIKFEYQKWQENDYLIGGLPAPFRFSGEAKELHSAFLEAQTNFKEKLVLILQVKSDTYTTGIEYQIKRLKDTDDQPAIDLLNKEIKRVKSDSKYFGSLMTD